MLQNVDGIIKLQGVARAKNRNFITKTLRNQLVDEALQEGWAMDQQFTNSSRLKKPKAHFTILEDRVWMLLYRMGFGYLSNASGAILPTSGKAEDGPKTKLDVVGIDDEVALAIECKSAEKPSRRPQFQEELGKLALVRQSFANSVNNQYANKVKRQVVLVMFLSNVILSENDRVRARDNNILIFDEKDLTYYEALVRHSGPVAKYQLFADMLPGKSVTGLEIKVPAIRVKIGGSYAYTFCIAPSYLLKIAYVSHRAKGKGADINTYQRMIRKSRLSRIREYINDGGVFPTNIVINLDKKSVDFHRMQQVTEGDIDTHRGIFGWLDIRPAYGSAWVIDGQHRLFAYSGEEKANSDLLPVLAFENLKPSEQANLFVEINSKQKAVKQSLLNELFAELKWDSDDPKERIAAIISKSFQTMNADAESPLYAKIVPVDTAKDITKCISLTSLCSATDKCNFYVRRVRHSQVPEYGPFWQGDNDATLRRTVYILSNWLSIVQSKTEDWWAKGAGDGGGLAMNEGIMTLIRVLGSVFDFFEASGQKLVHLDDEDLIESVRRYGEALGDYLASMSSQERTEFRRFRAEQGIRARMMRCQKGIRDRIPEFNPDGLDKYLEEEKAQTNQKANVITDYIEATLQQVIIEELQREYGEDRSQWWIQGVPKTIRVEATNRWEEDNHKRGEPWYYFNLIDYRKIATANWPVFEKLLGYGKGNKDKRTDWITFVNEIRNAVSHISSGVSISLEQLTRLQEYRDWLTRNVNGAPWADEKDSTDTEQENETETPAAA